jgi:hypothetical protein
MSRADCPMTGAERMRAYRDRKKHGKCMVLMEADKGNPMFAAFAATDAEQRKMDQSYEPLGFKERALTGNR